MPPMLGPSYQQPITAGMVERCCQDAVTRQETTEAGHFQGAHDGLLRIDSFLPAMDGSGLCPGVLGCGMEQFS